MLLKNKLTEMKKERDLVEEITSLVYTASACDGKSLQHLLYDRLRRFTHAAVFVRRVHKLIVVAQPSPPSFFRVGGSRICVIVERTCRS